MPDNGNWQRQLADNAQRYQDLTELVSRLSITERSRDGTVTVTVSASGVLTDLVLKQRWHPVPMPELAAQIMDCLRRAQAKIPELLARAMAETVGTRDPSTHVILADSRKRFPEPPPDPADSRRWSDKQQRIEDQTTVPEPRPVPARQQPVTEDDWDERPVLEDL